MSWAALSALALSLAPATLAAQDGQFDLRDRATPTPEPTVVGPVDPENPVPRAQPRVRPTAPPSPLVVPSATPTPSAAVPPAESASAAAARPDARAPTPGRGIADRPPPPVTSSQVDGASPLTRTQPTPPLGRRPATPYQPRNLDLVAESGGIGLWLALGGLALFLAVAGWLAWSRYLRVRVAPASLPEIERPRLAPAAPKPRPPAAPPLPPAPADSHAGLQLTLQATRMSATLMNTTLSYRLSLTNRSATTVRNVRVDGDMVAAHATRPHQALFGPFAPVLPELHHVPTLAPGETVTLGGDIRLPLVAITPIRRGNAAFFVPLARLRAHGTAPTGISVEGGGTFLVGQEPGANRKLQPFRLDLGPRNYSKLGQHLLPAA